MAAMFVNGSELQTWPPQAIFASDWLISKKSSPLKPLCRINRNFEGSILGMTSIKIAHLVAIREQTWPEEKMFSEISQSEPRMTCGGHVCYRIGTK
jgi:hypothetical protein